MSTIAAKWLSLCPLLVASRRVHFLSLTHHDRPTAVFNGCRHKDAYIGDPHFSQHGLLKWQYCGQGTLRDPLWRMSSDRLIAKVQPVLDTSGLLSLACWTYTNTR